MDDPSPPSDSTLPSSSSSPFFPSSRSRSFYFIIHLLLHIAALVCCSASMGVVWWRVTSLPSPTPFVADGTPWIATICDGTRLPAETCETWGPGGIPDDTLRPGMTTAAACLISAIALSWALRIGRRCAVLRRVGARGRRRGLGDSLLLDNSAGGGRRGGGDEEAGEDEMDEEAGPRGSSMTAAGLPRLRLRLLLLSAGADALTGILAIAAFLRFGSSVRDFFDDVVVPRSAGGTAFSPTLTFGTGHLLCAVAAGLSFAASLIPLAGAWVVASGGARERGGGKGGAGGRRDHPPAPSAPPQ
jgi:hypothetical protein